MNAFTWTNRWVGRYEAYNSLMWKFAWANEVSMHDLRQHATFQDETTPCDGGGSGTTPARADWVMPFAQASGYHDIHRLTGRWGRVLVGGRATRFCPMCLQAGYVSIFHQVSILRRCPIHKRELVDTCQCGAHSPYYRIIDIHIAKPFHCAQCGLPLSGLFDAGLMIRADRTIHPLESAFDPLADWLTRLQSFPWEPPHSEDAEQREYIAAVLQGVVPLKLDPSLLRGAKLPVSFGVFTELRATGDVAFYLWRRDPDIQALVNAVRRHIHRRYIKGRKRHVRLYRDTARLCWGDNVFCPRAGVHPLVHAYWAWRCFVASNVEACRFGSLRDDLALGKNAKPLELWHGMQVSPLFQMHYLLASYFDCVRLTLEQLPPTAGPSPDPGQSNPAQKPLIHGGRGTFGPGEMGGAGPHGFEQVLGNGNQPMPSPRRRMFPVWSSVFWPRTERRFTPREYGYSYVARSIADEARALPWRSVPSIAEHEHCPSIATVRG